MEQLYSNKDVKKNETQNIFIAPLPLCLAVSALLIMLEMQVAGGSILSS